MALAELYPQIKLAHMVLVTASGALFALRGSAVLAGRSWPMRALPRLASVLIDTVLLVAGTALWTMLSLDPLRDAWLGMKLLLLLLYIVLGTLALKRARAPAFAAAMLCFLFMVSVAMAHHPLGVLRTLLG